MKRPVRKVERRSFFIHAFLVSLSGKFLKKDIRLGMEAIDLKNKTISSLGKEGTTSPFGGLDGIESDASNTHYYVTDNPAGKRNKKVYC